MAKAQRPRAGPGDSSPLRIILTGEEYEVLCQVPGHLRGVLLDPESAPQVIDRLFPPAHRDDPEEEAEHRRLLGNTLWQARLQNLEAFERTLQKSERWHNRVQVDLTEGEVDLWLHVVNDVRLLLGTELNVQSNHWLEEGVQEPGQRSSYYLLAALSALQEMILTAIKTQDRP